MDIPTLRMTKQAHYVGHRARVKDKILKTPSPQMADYELLEAILFFSQPRVDTKPLAKDLLKKFSSLSALCLADPKDILTTKGMGTSSVCLLKLVRMLALRMGEASMQNRFRMGTADQVVKYCRLRLKDPSIEQFHVFFLDHHQQLIHETIHQVGTVNQAAVYPREIIKEALTYGASYMMLAHNHPTGNCTPSPADIQLTEHLIDAGKRLGIHILDHIVFSLQGYTSMKTEGYLKFS